MIVDIYMSSTDSNIYEMSVFGVDFFAFPFQALMSPNLT